MFSELHQLMDSCRRCSWCFPNSIRSLDDNSYQRHHHSQFHFDSLRVVVVIQISNYYSIKVFYTKSQVNVINLIFFFYSRISWILRSIFIVVGMCTGRTLWFYGFYLLISGSFIVLPPTVMWWHLLEAVIDLHKKMSQV